MKSAACLELDDAALLAAAGRGDAPAFRKLLERHASAVHRVAYRMLGDPTEAEDATQDAFLRLWKQAAGWQSSGAGVPAWLRRVVTNLCLDRLRRAGQTDGTIPADPIDDGPSASTLLDRARLSAMAHRALMSLSANQRAAVVLTYYEELANGAAAEVLGMNVKAFESLLLRGRRALREHIDQTGFSAADMESWQ